MLKNRLIPTIILKNDLVVQSFNFKNYLPIGRIDAVVEFFNNWDVDEIIVIDIDASRDGRIIDPRLIERIAKNCFVPLAVGGGIRNEQNLKDLLSMGIEKIIINKVIFDDQNFIEKISSKYGKQFIVASLDAKLIKDDYYIFVDNGKRNTGMKVKEASIMVEEKGAGEIFINSIDRDGSRLGYDTKLLKIVSSSVKIPVIACGGVGKASHLAEAITKGGCQASSAANIFQHTELSTIVGKSIMKSKGLPIRIDTKAKYDNFHFDEIDRPI